MGKCIALEIRITCSPSTNYIYDEWEPVLGFWSRVKTLSASKACGLREIHMIEGQYEGNQITSDRRYKRRVIRLCSMHSIHCWWSPNECWLHTFQACVIATCRLGLRAPLVARNYAASVHLSSSLQFPICLQNSADEKEINSSVHSPTLE